MKTKIINLLKKNGFEKCDTNLYGNDMFGVLVENNRIVVNNNSGDIVADFSMNYYTMVGFLSVHNSKCLNL